MRTDHISLKEKQKTSGQHCCSLHGWLTCLLRVGGHFSVIIHSDMNCSNLVFKGDSDDEMFERIFCTNMTEEDIIMGNGIKRLDECIDAVMEYNSPKDILILDSCMSQIIGDDVKGLITRKRKDIDAELYYKDTSGLVFEDPKNIIDEVGHFLLEMIDVEERDRDRGAEILINIIGFEYYQDNERVKDFFDELGKMGIKVNTVIGPKSGIEEWARSLDADLNVSFDKRLYNKVMSIFEEKHGLETIEVPFPVGLGPTIRFINKICEKMDTDHNDKIKVLQDDIENARSYLEKNSDALREKKVIYNIASNMDFTVSNSAREGLLMLDFFKELGCDVEILIQGNPEDEHKRDVEETLSSIGIEEKFTLFGHCGDGYKFLDGNKDTIVYGATLLMAQAVEMGNRFMAYEEILPGISAMKKNIDKVIGKHEH